MLNAKEVAVMRFIYETCSADADASCILSSEKIVFSLPDKASVSIDDIEGILKELEYDGYFELTKAEKAGKMFNVISLKEKGKAFEREMVQRRREIASNIIWRIVYAVIAAAVTLLITNLI